MDYGENVEIVRHAGWSTFLETHRQSSRRLVLFTTKGAATLQSFAFQADDILLFGRESAGVPDHVHEAADGRVLIPMQPGQRSINVAMSAAMMSGEALRQTGFGV
jgi:tRNA (cytidine/uridine-2'-O-)-methyltransferase